jgi:hypothetical protein
MMSGTTVSTVNCTHLQYVRAAGTNDSSIALGILFPQIQYCTLCNRDLVSGIGINAFKLGCPNVWDK